MGSGKSTIARLLSESWGISYSDLDEIIEKKTNQTVKNIFETKGEIYFRKIEHEIFRDLMNNSEEMILSLGGGTPCYANNHEFLNGEGVLSIYLKASIDTLYNRLKSEKDKRPLVANESEEELREFIAKHLFDRSYYYNQAALKIDVDDKSPQMVVEEIKKKLA
jgi:shikimate kinase